MFGFTRVELMVYQEAGGSRKERYCLRAGAVAERRIWNNSLRYWQNAEKEGKREEREEGKEGEGEGSGKDTSHHNASYAEGTGGMPMPSPW